jgi:RIO kinase 1
MRVPDTLLPLLDAGIIQDVIRPLMSGKEADVYLVEVDGEVQVAKTYKDAAHRSFKHRAEYTEGRKVKNSRSQRAMAKRSRFGRAQIEDAWRTTEVDIIFRLADAGVRVPQPIAFVEGVLVMQLVQGHDYEPAPRLVDADFTEDEAWACFHDVLQEVVKMLCAGVVHGDLSDFNVLLAWDGPVIIDFPQAVDAAQNRNAKKLLVRDVRNLTSFLGRYTKRLRKTNYGEEMWALYEAGDLRPDTKLTGRYRASTHQADTTSLLAEIEALEAETRRKREALGLKPRRPARAPVVARETPPAAQEERPKKKRRRRRKKPTDGPPPAAAGSERRSRPKKPRQPDPLPDFEATDDLDAFLSD